MKRTIAITLSVLFAGCAADEADSLDQSRDYPDDIEIVVIAPVDVGDVDTPSSLQRPEFPGSDYKFVGNDSDDTAHKLPPKPERPTFDGNSDEIDNDAGDARPHSLGGLDRPSSPERMDLLDTPLYPDPTIMSDESTPTEDPCTCADSECMEEWIADNLGCNVCATFVCGDEHTAGACYLCD